MDNLEVELVIKDDRAEVVLGKNRQKIEDFVKTVEGKSPTLKFKVAGESFIDLDKLEKRAESTRAAFQDIARTRLDNGQIGNLTKEVVRAAERSRQLESDIKSIKRELANPNRKSSIKFLTDELQAAQIEADRLNRKLNSLPSGSPDGRRLDGSTRRGSGGDLKLSSFQKQNLSYQVNDVLTGLASGQNPLQILAQQGGQIAQIFDPAQIAAFAAKYSALVGILGAGAAAIALTYKLTGDVRAEAERRLKVETAITAAQNKYILGQKEALKNLKEIREQAAYNSDFSQSLQNSSIESLIRQRETLEKLLSISNPGDERAEITNGKILEINAQIKAIGQNNTNAANDAFNQRWESWKKSQESAADFAVKQQEKFNKSVEDGENKIKELEKTYASVLDNLFQKQGSNNPFVALFSEADRSMRELRENTRGLSQDLISVFENMERQQNALKLFETRLNNNLEVFELRDRADRFRNPDRTEADKKRFDETVSSSISRGTFFAGGAFGTYGSFLANRAGGADKLTDAQKRDIYEVSMLSTLDPEKKFYDLNKGSLVRSLARQRLEGGDLNQSLNERLEKQLSIIYGSAGSADEKAIADRRFIGLTSSLDPSQLSADIREKAALANEREAVRKEQGEKDAAKTREEHLKVSKQIAADIKRLREINEKGGADGVKKQLTVELVDNSNGAARVTDKTPSAKDVNLLYSGGGTLTNF